MEKRRVVITGLGAVTPLGHTARETWEAAKAGVCGIAPITLYDHSAQKVSLAGEVKEFDPSGVLEKKEIRRMDRFAQFAVTAAAEAMAHSGLDLEREDRARIGVALSSGIGGIGTLQTSCETGQSRGFDRVSPFFIPMVITNLAAGHIAIRFGLHGMCICPVAACAGGANAVGDAFRHIRDGYAEVMVAGGAEASITPLAMGGFTSMSALTDASDPSRASIPFDKERSGFVMGEGAGMLLLEEYEHALARDAKIYAELVGYGNTCDAYHITAPHPEAEGAARALSAAGATKNDLIHVSYGYGLFTGGLGLHYGAEYMGATAIPVSSGNTKRQVQIMQDFGSNFLCCTPSYAMFIGETVRDMGIDPHSLALRGGLFGAEPWTDNMRREIEKLLDIKAYDIYGLSEIAGPGVAYDCEMQNGLHVNEDYFYPEVIDPDTLQPLPDGEYGELVFTCIGKEALPLIRYRTRDITRIISEPCACGRTHRKIDRIIGRSDDMLILRGVNVFPSQIEQVLTGFPEIATQYQIILTTRGPLDHVELRVETVPEFPFDEIRKLESLKKRLAAELKGNLQIAVDIKLVEPKSIERSEGKAKRIIDLRKE